MHDIQVSVMRYRIHSMIIRSERFTMSDNKIKKAVEVAVTLLFPRRCPVCGQPVKPYYRLVCAECEDRIDYVKEPYCMKCGKELTSGEKEYCHDCISHVHSYDTGRALFEYRSMERSIYDFKYKGRQEYAEFYGERIAQRLGGQIISWKPDALIPIPVHASRKRERGYNQAEVLAEAIGKRLGIPVIGDWMVRSRKTAPQKELGPSERQNNVKKAFKIIHDDVKLNTIVIIDDIYTTGSTIDAAAVCARAAGVKKVFFVALAIGKGM